MNIINNKKENHKMLRIRAIVLGMLTVATSMAAEGGLLGAGIGAGIVVLVQQLMPQHVSLKPQQIYAQPLIFRSSFWKVLQLLHSLSAS